MPRFIRDPSTNTAIGEYEFVFIKLRSYNNTPEYLLKILNSFGIKHYSQIMRMITHIEM